MPVTKPANIKLEYPLHIHRAEDVFSCPKGAEFFLDEHGIQWVKFVPTNGYRHGKEHMFRTEHIGITRISDD